MIIGFTLLILIVICLFSIVLGSTFTGAIVENIVDNSLLINGTGTTMEIDSSTLFNIDPFIGMTATIVIIVALAAIVGIQILASGLSPESVRIIVIGIAYGGVWIVFSLLASPLIISIEIFGGLIYITLTIGYVIGVIQQLAD